MSQIYCFIDYLKKVVNKKYINVQIYTFSVSENVDFEFVYSIECFELLKNKFKTLFDFYDLDTIYIKKIDEKEINIKFTIHEPCNSCYVVINTFDLNLDSIDKYFKPGFVTEFTPLKNYTVKITIKNLIDLVHQTNFINKDKFLENLEEFKIYKNQYFYVINDPNNPKLSNHLTEIHLNSLFFDFMNNSQ